MSSERATYRIVYSGGAAPRVRQQGNEVALHLDEQGIPFPEIIREQMFLRRHYQVQRTMEVGDPVARRNRI